MTEFSTGIIYNLQEDYLRKPDSVGTVNPLFDVKIVDEETGEELPRGEKGEIWAKGKFILITRRSLVSKRPSGPGVIAGYYKRPEANAKDFTPDGYLKTGGEL
jgi:long-subunit acyl-CoA synthetase (AMP-forming)